MSKKLMAKFPGVDRHTGSKSPKAGPGQIRLGHYSSGLCSKMHGGPSSTPPASGKRSPSTPFPAGGKKPKTGP